MALWKARVELFLSLIELLFLSLEQEGQHPLTGQRAANFRLLGAARGFVSPRHHAMSPTHEDRSTPMPSLLRTPIYLKLNLKIQRGG